MARSLAAFGRHVEVRPDRLDDLEADRVDRVQRRHRLLEDHRDLLAADAPHGGPLEADELLALELRAAGRAPVDRQQPEQRHRRLGLAGAGLAHDGEDLACVDVVADVDRGREPLAVDVEGDVQVLDLEDRAVVVLGYDGSAASSTGTVRYEGAHGVPFGPAARAVRHLSWCRHGRGRDDQVALRAGAGRGDGGRRRARAGLAAHRRRRTAAAVRRARGAVRPARLGGLLAALRRGLRRRRHARQHPADGRGAVAGHRATSTAATDCACARRTGPSLPGPRRAPSGRRRAVGPSSSRGRGASTARLESLRGAGHLDDPRLERPAPRHRWHVPDRGRSSLLLVATVTLPLLA